MEKQVIIYSTKNAAGMAPCSEIEKVFHNTTRREAFETFIGMEKRNPMKWRFNKRSLTAVYTSGKRHGREEKFFFVEYMSENEFYDRRQKERDSFVSGRGENWEEYQERINKES